MKYFGHVERMPDNRFPYTAMLLPGRVHGQRIKGRPHIRWLENVREDCERARLTQPQAVRDAHKGVLA